MVAGLSRLARAQLAAKEEPAVAVATLRSAKTMTDRPEEASIDLASLLEQSGKPDEAMKEYEEILHANPQSEVAANNLAMLLATYRNDPASLDRAKELSSRFANSPNPVLPGYLRLGAVQARRRSRLGAGIDAGGRKNSECSRCPFSSGHGAVAGGRRRRRARQPLARRQFRHPVCRPGRGEGDARQARQIDCFGRSEVLTTCGEGYCL